MKVFTTPTSLDHVLEPSPDMKESVMAVEKIVGYNFKNKKLLEEALTHPSFTGSASYQRLEVLGDSALNHAVTNYFFCMADHQKFTQGQITKLRSANAENLNLARLAVRHGLYRYLRRQNTPDLDDQVREFSEAVINGEEIVESEEAKVLADIVESVAAAIYIELNFDLDKLWMKFKPLLEPIYTLENLQDHPMTILKEFCEKSGKRLEVRLRYETGNISIADVYVDGKFVASGSSNKVKGAKRNAAKAAVNKLCQSVVVDDGSFQGSAVGNNMSFRIEEAIHGLHVLCAKKRLPKPPEYKEENVSGPPHDMKYVYSVKVVTSDGTVQSVMGDEKSQKKKAKNSASYKMILALQEYDNMFNTLEYYRKINSKEADHMINTKASYDQQQRS